MDAPRTCYRHPDRETGLSCSECDRPICYECMTPAAVGLRCPEHSGKPQGIKKVTAPRAACRHRRRPARRINAITIGADRRKRVRRGGGVSRVAATPRSRTTGSSSTGRSSPPAFLFTAGGPVMGVAQGEWWRLFTSMFLHVNFFHLAVNMYSPVLRRLDPRAAGRPLAVPAPLPRRRAAAAAGPLSTARTPRRPAPPERSSASSARCSCSSDRQIIHRRPGHVADRAEPRDHVRALELISVGGHLGGLIGGILADVAAPAVPVALLHDEPSRPWTALSPYSQWQSPTPRCEATRADASGRRAGSCALGARARSVRRDPTRHLRGTSTASTPLTGQQSTVGPCDRRLEPDDLRPDLADARARAHARLRYRARERRVDHSSRNRARRRRHLPARDEPVCSLPTCGARSSSGPSGR